MWATSDRRVFTPLLLALIVLAWLALIVWGYSPWAAYLNHDQLEGVSLTRSPAPLAILVGGWTLMTAAMMLPTSLPLVLLFRRMTVRRAEGQQLVLLLIVGYLVVWAGFGLAVHVADLVLHDLVVRSGWLEANAWLIGGITLGIAGAYQFTALKYRCLDECRSPLAFISRRWRGRDERRQSFRLGVEHGVFCVGCCWSLMLLMFIVGLGNIVWMLVLGAIMAVEKNMPWGRRLSHPLGVALLACAVLLPVSHVL
jgi:predicted metal-binding membrane protein